MKPSRLDRATCLLALALLVSTYAATRSLMAHARTSGASGELAIAEIRAAERHGHVARFRVGGLEIFARRAAAPAFAGNATVVDADGRAHTLTPDSDTTHVAIGRVHAVLDADGIAVVCAEADDVRLGVAAVDQIRQLAAICATRDVPCLPPPFLIVCDRARHAPSMWAATPSSASSLLTSGDSNGAVEAEHSVARMLAARLVRSMSGSAEPDPGPVTMMAQRLQYELWQRISPLRADARHAVMLRHLLARIRARAGEPPGAMTAPRADDRERFDAEAGPWYRVFALLEARDAASGNDHVWQRTMPSDDAVVERVAPHVASELAAESRRTSVRELAAGRDAVRIVSSHSGFVEDCGCKGRKSGGFAGLLEAMSGDLLPCIAAGNMVASPHTTRYSTAMAHFIAERTTADRFLVVPGGNEFADITIRGTARRPSWVIANASGPTVARSGTVPMTVGRRTVHLMGVFDPAGCGRTADVAQFAQQHDWVDPATAVLAECSALPGGAALLVVGNWWPTSAELSALPPGTIVVCSDHRLGGERATGDRYADGSHTIGASAGSSSYLLACDAYQYGAHLLDISDAGEVVWETRSLPTEIADPAIRAALDRLWHDPEASDLPPVAHADDAALAAERGYIGSAACARCHAAQHAAWHGSAHAHAMTTLQKVQRTRAASCVRCHVVGFGVPGGYAMPHTEGLDAVGCESCHGPGGMHAAGSPTAIVARPGVERCVSCHDVEHSDLHDAPDRYLDAIRQLCRTIPTAR